jgi:hypothetical protein
LYAELPCSLAIIGMATDCAGFDDSSRTQAQDELDAAEHHQEGLADVSPSLRDASPITNVRPAVFPAYP